MDWGGVVCVICKGPPTDPHRMLCGHTFCLHPCLLPQNSNQDFVECPLCRIETPLAYVEPGIAGQSPSSKTSSVCQECCRSVSLKCQFCQHCSKTICQACANLHLAEVLTPLVKKFISLQSERIALASLKATLSQLKDNKDSCKERLLSEVTLAVGQLQWSADSALEKAKLVVVSTSAEDQARLKKLQGDLKTLMQMQAALGQTADSIQRGEGSDGLKTFVKSTGKLLRKIKKLDKSMVVIKRSGINNLTTALKFETIQLQLQNLRLLTSDYVELPYPQQSEAQTGCPATILSPYPRADCACPETDLGDSGNNSLDLTSIRPTIVVGRLKPDTTETDITNYFSKYGKVKRVKMLTRNKTGEFRGYALVTFADKRAFEDGVLEKDHSLDDCPFKVRLAMSNASSTQPQVQPGAKSKQNVDTNRVYLRSLPPAANKQNLNEYFSKFGIVNQVRVLKGRKTGGNGFVVFRDLDSISKVLESQPHRINETQITVSLTKNPESSGTRSQANLEQNVNPKRIYLGSLPPAVNRQNLNEYFSKFGIVNQVCVLTGRKTRGIGLVVFRDLDSVRKVLESQPHQLNGTQITVARTKKALSAGNCLSKQPNGNQVV
ncbi:heteroproteinous nuclear ribonucleoprotein [Sparganum proliferum]